MDERARAEESPYQEAQNSTVDDWHGQELAREEERADRLVDEAGGDLGEAQTRFEEGVKVPHRTHDQPAEGGREEIEKGLEPNDDGTLPVGG
jgi:hypothetical protein